MSNNSSCIALLLGLLLSMHCLITNAQSIEQSEELRKDRISRALNILRSAPKVIKRVPRTTKPEKYLSLTKPHDPVGDVNCDDTSCSCSGYIACWILKEYCGGTYSGSGEFGKCS